MAKSVLSDEDVDLYQRVFRYQEKSDFNTAKQLAKKIKDTSLMGYVLYDRYFSKHYSTKKNEISEWLKKYEDLWKLKSDLIRILGYKQEDEKQSEKSFIKFDNIFGKNS